LLLSSNIYFWLTANYFDNSAVYKPLLHTWSLSLEEQYYMVYPLFILTTRFSRHPRAFLSSCLGAVAVASYGVCLVYQKPHPNFAFYMLPARAYEFALGGLAFFLESQVSLHGGMAELASASGLVAIVASYILLPGGARAAFCLPSALGTALIIITPSSVFNRSVLSSGLAMFIGRISYAAYLVHWPIFVYVRYLSLGTQFPLALYLGVLLIMTFLLALLLHHAVETPMRTRGTKYWMHIIVLLFCSFGLARSGIATRGWRFRQDIPPEPFSSKDRRFCADVDGPQRGPKDAIRCIVGHRSAELPFEGQRHAAVVIGSSFAGHLLAAFDHLAVKHNTTYLFHIGSGCPISSETDNVLSSQVNNAAREQEKWCVEMNGERWKLVKGLFANQSVVLSDEWIGPWGAAKGINAAKDVRRNGKRVVIAGAIPGVPRSSQPLASLSLDWQWLPIGRLARRLGLVLDFPTRIGINSGQADSNKAFLNETRVNKGSFYYVNILDNFCALRGQTYHCEYYNVEEGVRRSLYHDGWHLSYYGSRRVASLFGEALIER
jgi:hypothetical protein